jgi:regulatory protein
LSFSPKIRYVSRDEALVRLQKWCAQEEHSHSAARKKLYEWKIYGDDAEQIILSLIEDDFLNERRFACAYSIGKLRQNRWGKIKIQQGLKQHQVSSYNIKFAFEEIEQDEYLECLNYILAKKLATLSDGLTFENKLKLQSFAQQKGFEMDLIHEGIKTIDNRP